MNKRKLEDDIFIKNKKSCIDICTLDIISKNDILIISEKITYIGEHVNNIPHGYGKFINIGGSYFEGYFINGRGQLPCRAYIILKDGIYEGSITEKSILPTGYGKLTLNNGDIYEGNFINTKLHGRCKITTNMGYYEGNFIDGILTDEIYGNILLTDGNRFEGKLILEDGELVFDRIGKLHYKSGRIFEGEIINNKPNGDGKIILTCGTIIEGKFINDTPIKGEKYNITYKNGSSYEGGLQLSCGYEDIIKYEKKGFGITKTPKYTIEVIDVSEHTNIPSKYKKKYLEGSYYIGELYKNLYHGNGELYDSNNKLVSKGYYLKGKLVEGIEYYSDDSYYEGCLKDNLYHGKGKLFNNHGKLILDGTFENGTIINGIRYYNNGFRYEGQFKNDLREGDGKLFDNNNTLLGEGLFIQNSLSYGIIHNKNGTYYVGELENNLYNGIGKVYDNSNKLIFDGEFKAGKPISGTLYNPNGTTITL